MRIETMRFSEPTDLLCKTNVFKKYLLKHCVQYAAITARCIFLSRYFHIMSHNFRD